jgi:O-methyltransferase involved in polyketide biosynthesis
MGEHRPTSGAEAGTRVHSFVDEALDDDVRQVVIVAAGYDSRAWRL